MERSSKKSNRNANKKGRNYKKDVDESKNDPDNDEQARQQYLDQLNDLVNRMFEICGQMPDLPPSCEIHLTKFKQCINGDIDDFFNKIDVDQTIGHLQAFIKLLHLNDHQRKELNELVNDMETITYKLRYDLCDIRSQIRTMKKDKQDLKETVDELIDDRNSIKTALSDLTKEVHQLRQNASDKVLAETYAHLLHPLIRRIGEEFKIRNEQTKNMSLPTSYSMITHYNTKILKDLLSGGETSDAATQLVSNVINEFSKTIGLTKDQVIELLLKKAKKNYIAHGYIDLFINDLIAGEYEPDDFFKYIEEENLVDLSIGNKDKNLLLKLLQYNVLHRQESNK